MINKEATHHQSKGSKFEKLLGLLLLVTTVSISAIKHKVIKSKFLEKDC